MCLSAVGKWSLLSQQCGQRHRTQGPAAVPLPHPGMPLPARNLHLIVGSAALPLLPLLLGDLLILEFKGKVCIFNPNSSF